MEMASGARPGSPVPSERSMLPNPSLFSSVVGQARAVSNLRSAAGRPVHAYLLHGPSGSGKRAAARAFAASILCPNGGCGNCGACDRALRGIHSDLVTIERSGASLDIGVARTVVAQALRRPREGARQVLVVADVHLATTAAPALLKTVEEPPPGTIFVLLADDLPESLATIASRCVKVGFEALSPGALTEWLISTGVDADRAASIAAMAGGRIDRARLLATDQEFSSRQTMWRAVPARLDGSGATAVVVVGELLDAVDQSVSPLRTEHQAELAELADRAEIAGMRGIAGRKEVEDRHKREERRWRTDDLRAGLSVLAAVYRDRLLGGEDRRAIDAVAAIEHTASALRRNPNEVLLFESLMVALAEETS